jgi:3-hydroxyacyl-CoA dehydrogenase
MTNPVTLTQQNDIAVIAMDSPPVNALGHALREAILTALNAIPEGTKAIILHGTPRAFSGGADITEFGKPSQDPNLRHVIAAIEDSPIPVIAAIQGVALGGGLELALGCHARVAWKGARLGLPEVKLGLLPGAGGTQRLPRIVGVEKALSMIVTGNPVSAEEALKIGLVDAILEGAYPQAAIDWAAIDWAAIDGAAIDGAKGDIPKTRVRDRDAALQPAKDDPTLIDRLAVPLLKANPAESPRACVESIRAATTMSFDEACANSLKPSSPATSPAPNATPSSPSAKPRKPSSPPAPNPAPSTAPPSSVPAPWVVASPCASPMPASP